MSDNHAESEEKAFLVERAQNAARRVMSIATRNAGRGGKASRGGRGASRGGRGRGGGRGGDSRSKKDGLAANGTTEVGHRGDGEQAGEKRKRAVEPDGPADSGVRGAGIPIVESAKKAKTDETPPAAAAP